VPSKHDQSTLCVDGAATLTGGTWHHPTRRKNRFEHTERRFAILQEILHGDRDQEIAASLGKSHSIVRE
jgi:DNA-binding NarL/FixJ family response regulator